MSLIKILYFLPGVLVKGQIISKCPYAIIVYPKIATKFFSEISALVSKERSNQKNKGTLLY